MVLPIHSFVIPFFTANTANPAKVKGVSNGGKTMKKLCVCTLVILMTACLSLTSWAQEKKQFRIVSGAMGSTTYNLCVAFASVVEKHSDLRLFVEPSAGSSAQALLLSKGEADISELPSAHCVTLRNGSKGYEKAFPHYVGNATPVRLLVSGHILPFGILMRKKSWVESISDLKGKKLFGASPGTAGIEMTTRAYLAVAGLEYDKDVKILSMSSTTDGVDRVNAGEADGVVLTYGGSKIYEFATNDGGWYINAPVDEKSMETYNKFYPGVVPWTAEQDGPCMKKGTHFFGFPDYLSTTKRLSDEAAYKITKAVLENTEELAKINPLFKEWSLERAVKYAVIPFHPGAVKFYKEKGVWNADLDKLQEKLLSEGL